MKTTYKPKKNIFKKFIIEPKVFKIEFFKNLVQYIQIEAIPVFMKPFFILLFDLKLAIKSPTRYTYCAHCNESPALLEITLVVA